MILCQSRNLLQYRGKKVNLKGLDEIHYSFEVLSDVDSYGVASESDSDSEVEVTADHEAALSEVSSASEMDDMLGWLL